jgi:hypothetical protein
MRHVDPLARLTANPPRRGCEHHAQARLPRRGAGQRRGDPGAGNAILPVLRVAPGLASFGVGMDRMGATRLLGDDPSGVCRENSRRDDRNQHEPTMKEHGTSFGGIGIQS